MFGPGIRTGHRPQKIGKPRTKRSVDPWFVFRKLPRTYQKGNDIWTTCQIFQNFDFTLDFLLFYWFQNFDDTFFVIRYIDGFEYFRVFASTQFSYELKFQNIFHIKDRFWAYLIIVLVSPFDHVTFIIPVFSWTMRIHISIDTSP